MLRKPTVAGELMEDGPVRIDRSLRVQEFEQADLRPDYLLGFFAHPNFAVGLSFHVPASL